MKFLQCINVHLPSSTYYLSSTVDRLQSVLNLLKQLLHTPDVKKDRPPPSLVQQSPLFDPTDMLWP